MMIFGYHGIEETVIPSWDRLGFGSLKAEVSLSPHWPCESYDQWTGEPFSTLLAHSQLSFIFVVSLKIQTLSPSSMSLFDFSTN